MSVWRSSYNVIEDFGSKETDSLSMSAYWIVAVIRLGQPLSFSRVTMSSLDSNIISGALLRNDAPLIITDDCLHLEVHNSKLSHTKSLSMSLKQTDTNYLVEVLPGDWVMAWIVNNEGDYVRVLQSIEDSEPSNGFRDGFKFLGRIASVRKTISVDRAQGFKSATYHIAATGFQELDTQLFFDNTLSRNEDVQGAMGQWLGRLGLEMDMLFAKSAKGFIEKDNINKLIPTLIDLIVGKGPSIEIRAEAAKTIKTTGQAGRTASDMPSMANSAPYSYLVPMKVGQLLGVAAEGGMKVLGYASILEQIIGVQAYYDVEVPKMFSPSIMRTEGRRHFTDAPMLGTFPPITPECTNRPLWSVLQQYLNPVINEMYTALRVNKEGQVMPTLVVRQIPFTTEVFDPEMRLNERQKTEIGGAIRCTRFLELPRWVVPDVMVNSIDVGRSDHTHFNFVHIYGAFQGGNPWFLQYQLVENPPIRDDIDIMRSGLRPYMTTVQCFTSDHVGAVPGVWMALVADFVVGSHYTYNGTLQCLGIQSPICEGDNLEFDGVVFHIETVSHRVGIGYDGSKDWTTTLTLTNGMRAVLDKQVDGKNVTYPMYPGFDRLDGTQYDPGRSEEQSRSRHGDSVRELNPDAEARRRLQQEENERRLAERDAEQDG